MRFPANGRKRCGLRTCVLARKSYCSMRKEPNIRYAKCVQSMSKRIERAGNCGLKLQLLSSNEIKQRQQKQRVLLKTDSVKKLVYATQMELLGIHVSSNKSTKVSMS